MTMMVVNIAKSTWEFIAKLPTVRWSLLEKFSCSASKLHLKPWRFETFVEALGKQLAKDINKFRRKRSQVDICLLSPSPIISKAPGNEDPHVIFLSVDAQNDSRVASLKGAISSGLQKPIFIRPRTTKRELPATGTVNKKEGKWSHLFFSLQIL